VCEEVDSGTVSSHHFAKYEIWVSECRFSPPMFSDMKFGSCQAVPLQFLHALLTYLGDSVDYDSGSSGLKSPLASRPSSFPGIGVPSEALVRWHMRLEYFAYETLQDLRIGKLFEIIVDYPERSVIFPYMVM
jgi:hypothetical protein